MLTYLQERRKQAMYDARYIADFSRNWMPRGRESCLETLDVDARRPVAMNWPGRELMWLLRN